MKTPREILLERHRSVEAKLDDVRRNVLTSLSTLPEPLGRRLLREFAAVRWHLAGMTAVWTLVALLQFDRAAEPSTLVSEGDASPPRDFLLTLLENRRQLVEMIDPALGDMPSEQPVIPRRRSQAPIASAAV